MEEVSKEAELGRILAEIAAHALALLGELGERWQDLAFVRDALSPDGNDACVKLGRLKLALLKFAPGEIAHVWLTEWHTASMRLVEAVRERYPEIESLHHTWNAQKGLYDLLTTRYVEYETREAYYDEIRRKIDVLKRKYRENSNGCNQLLVRQHSRGDEVPPKRVRGRTTDAETARRREEKRRILAEICRRYEVCGGRVSYLKIVEEMKRGTYAARLRGKKAQTWADQASSFGKCGGLVKGSRSGRDGSSPEGSPESSPESSPEISPQISPQSLSDGARSVLEMIKADDRLKTQTMAERLGISKRTVLKYIKELLTVGLHFEGPTKKGRWVIDGQ